MTELSSFVLELSSFGREDLIHSQVIFQVYIIKKGGMLREVVTASPGESHYRVHITSICLPLAGGKCLKA